MEHLNHLIVDLDLLLFNFFNVLNGLFSGCLCVFVYVHIHTCVFVCETASVSFEWSVWVYAVM